LSSVAIPVVAAELDQFAQIVALLAQAGLPTSDLTPASVDRFMVVVQGREVVGAVALERYGDVGLLRSLVVAPAQCREGVGRTLVRAIEDGAKAQGIDSLVLLTETAQEFFRELGFEVGKRSDAPAAVRSSSEFALICPTSAVYMQKHLHERPR